VRRLDAALQRGGLMPLLVSAAISRKKTIDALPAFKRRQAAAPQSGVEPPQSTFTGVP
jgi:hypothetical protein